MILDRIETVKINRLKLLMAKQRYDRTAPLILKNIFKGVSALGITYYALSGIVRVLNWLVQYFTKMGWYGVMELTANILLFVIILMAFAMAIKLMIGDYL